MITIIIYFYMIPNLPPPLYHAEQVQHLERVLQEYTGTDRSHSSGHVPAIKLSPTDLVVNSNNNNNSSNNTSTNNSNYSNKFSPFSANIDFSASLSSDQLAHTHTHITPNTGALSQSGLPSNSRPIHPQNDSSSNSILDSEDFVIERVTAPTTTTRTSRKEGVADPANSEEAGAESSSYGDVGGRESLDSHFMLIEDLKK